MAVDISKQGSKGGDSHYDTSQLRGVREERGIITGIVKANVHPTHNGVIKIWSPTFSTDEKDKAQWRTVRYCSPFYSRVDNSGVGDSYFGVKNPSGIVTPPPDLGTKVLAFFPEGRNSEGYYFACVPDLYMMQTLPEATTSDGVASGEFNDSPGGNHPGQKITNWQKQKRPEDFFTQNFLVLSGLSQDTVRGLSTSGYMRESPSEIIGIASKGRRITTDGRDFTVTNNAAIKNPDTADKRILEGLLGPTARRKGHSISLDDGDLDGNSNQVRFRTSTGHQILLNDTEGVIYISNSDGSCWIELSNAGTMDVYAEDSINFRSRNIQFHAGENIKFHSKGYTQIIADQNMHLQSNRELTIQSDGQTGITSTGLHLNSKGELFATSKSASYYNAGGNISVAGALVLLQGPKNQAQEAKKVKNLDKEDTTYNEDLDQFILDEEEMVTTTVDRLVMHEPFLYHGISNTTSPFTGGLAGGSGAPGGNYSIVGSGGVAPAPYVAGQTTATPGVASVPGAAASTSGAALPPGLSSIAQQAGVSEAQLQGQISKVQSMVGNIDTGAMLSQAQSQLGSIDTGALTSKFGNIGGSLGDITSNLNVGDIQGQLGAATSKLGGADFGKLISDSSGKITGLTDQLSSGLPGLPDIGNVTKSLPNLQDNLPSVLNAPALNKFPVTDLVQQANTGFSIGALDSFDTQALNAAVVKQVGSLNNPAFIDTATKSVGKFGFNVDQLKTQGLVRPEAIFNDQLSDTSVWTGKEGASSLNKFLGNSGLQDQVQQAVVATDYQKLVNTGGINFADGKKEIMSMLTASNVSSPEVATQVRQGFSQIEGVLQNTTNIPAGQDVASNVQQAMQTGAAAANRTEQINGKTKLEKETTIYGGAVTKSAQTQSNQTTVTGGGSTTTTNAVTGGKVTTGPVYTPSDDLLDEEANSTTKTDFSDEFNAEPLQGSTDDATDDDPYGLDAQQKQAEKREESEASKRSRKAVAEDERKKKLTGYARYKVLRDEARVLRKQWWANKSKLSKADNDALQAQIRSLLAQADVALNDRGSGDG